MKSFGLVLTLMALAANFTFSETACAQAEKGAPASRPQQQRSGPRNLAILIFDGVQIIDYTGPYETFGHVHVGDGHAFNIYTVSEKTNPITTAMGMSVNPKYGFDNAPEPDVLLVPGGNIQGALDNPAVIKWVRDKSQRAEMVLSVCNGAFLLAKTGLLDGLEATTTANLIPLLRAAAPKVKVVDDRRFVDNGKFITAAGLSSGIDGALHVVERLHGRGVAQMAALGMEYNWDPESKFVRAALADKYMRFNYDVKVAEGGWKPLSRAGSQDAWENRWSVTTDATAADVLASVNQSIAANRTYGGTPASKWVRADDPSAKGATRSLWRFTDEKGGAWDGTVSVEPVAGESNRFTLSVRVARGSASARVQ
ncbi:MAG TPA: DJ-1/PfpI family protein [Pyrinomonadaceae bacterium]|nr:DJ-1/PfpI family protein [Pyrinomonadaceae bacterium]